MKFLDSSSKSLNFNVSFGPEVRIDTELTYTAEAELNLQFGFDFNIPFSVKLQSTEGTAMF
jgi:hypothetical protein